MCARTSSGVSTSLRAFTLVEVLVALSLMVIILGVVYGAYSSPSRSVSDCKEKIRSSQEARVRLRALAYALRQCYARVRALPDLGSSGQKTASGGIEDADQPDFLAEEHSTGGNLLEFVAVRQPDATRSGPPGAARVAFRLDEANGLLLRRDRALGADSDSDSDQAWTPVARHVTAASFRYYDGKEWREEWNSRDEGGPPYAVAVKLTFAFDDGRRQSFQTATWLACHKPQGEVKVEESRAPSRR